MAFPGGTDQEGNLFFFTIRDITNDSFYAGESFLPNKLSFSPATIS